MRLFRTFLLVAAFAAFGADMALSAPGDVVVERKGKGKESYQAATFPHWVHAIRYRCYVCHPAVFKMVKFKLEKGTLKQDRSPFVAEKKAETGAKKAETGAAKKEKEAEKKITGEDSKAGAADPGGPNQMHGKQACGICHDGSNAFNVEFKTCGRCHLKD